MVDVVVGVVVVDEDKKNCWDVVEKGKVVVVVVVGRGGVEGNQNVVEGNLLGFVVGVVVVVGGEGEDNQSVVEGNLLGLVVVVDKGIVVVGVGKFQGFVVVVVVVGKDMVDQRNFVVVVVVVVAVVVVVGKGIVVEVVVDQRNFVVVGKGIVVVVAGKGKDPHSYGVGKDSSRREERRGERRKKIQTKRLFCEKKRRPKNVLSLKTRGNHTKAPPPIDNNNHSNTGQNHSK